MFGVRFGLKQLASKQQNVSVKRCISTHGHAGRLILVSHGPSEWNCQEQANTSGNRFTGWLDIPLSNKGRNRAREVGKMLDPVRIDCAVTSQLSRAQESLDIILEEMHEDEVPIVHSWRVNERHFGALVGLSKAEAERIYGPETVQSFRSDFEKAPPPMDKDMHTKWERQAHCQLVTSIYEDRDERILEQGRAWCNSREKMPLSESIKDCRRRVQPFWEKALEPRLKEGETILVVSHCNIIKVLLSQFDNLSHDDYIKLKVPSSTPLLYNFDTDSNNELHVIPTDADVEQRNSSSDVRLQGQWIDHILEEEEEEEYDELDIA